LAKAASIEIAPISGAARSPVGPVVGLASGMPAIISPTTFVPAARSASRLGSAPAPSLARGRQPGSP